MLFYGEAKLVLQVGFCLWGCWSVDFGVLVWVVI